MARTALAVYAFHANNGYEVPEHRSCQPIDYTFPQRSFGKTKVLLPLFSERLIQTVKEVIALRHFARPGVLSN